MRINGCKKFTFSQSPQALTKKSLIFFLILFFVESAFSENIKGLRVIGFKGKVNIVADSRALSPAVTTPAKSGPSWEPVIENVDGWYEVKVVGPSDKETWKKVNPPSVQLDIRSASLPLVVSWMEGEVNLQGWSKSAKITQKKGRIKVTSTSDNMELSLDEGDLEVQKHEGRLHIQSYDAKINLKSINGPIQIENFQGRLVASDLKGDLKLKSTSGKNKIDGIRGSLEIDSQKAEVNIVQLGGSLRGNSDAGIILGQIKGDVDVRLRGEQTRYSLSLLRGRGYKVDLGTEDGRLSAPWSLKSSRAGRWKLLKGNVPGKDASSVFVRSKSGDIRLRAL